MRHFVMRCLRQIRQRHDPNAVLCSKKIVNRWESSPEAGAKVPVLFCTEPVINTAAALVRVFGHEMPNLLNTKAEGKPAKQTSDNNSTGEWFIF